MSSCASTTSCLRSCGNFACTVSERGFVTACRMGYCFHRARLNATPAHRNGIFSPRAAFWCSRRQSVLVRPQGRLAVCSVIDEIRLRRLLGSQCYFLSFAGTSRYHLTATIGSETSGAPTVRLPQRERVISSFRTFSTSAIVGVLHF